MYSLKVDISNLGLFPLEMKDWWEAWLSALLAWKIIPSKWQMDKYSASSQSGRYLEDRQFPQGDEWKGSRMLRRKPGVFPVNFECKVGQMKAVFKRDKGKRVRV